MWYEIRASPNLNAPETNLNTEREFPGKVHFDAPFSLMVVPVRDTKAVICRNMNRDMRILELLARGVPVQSGAPIGAAFGVPEHRKSQIYVRHSAVAAHAIASKHSTTYREIVISHMCYLYRTLSHRHSATQHPATPSI